MLVTMSSMLYIVSRTPPLRTACLRRNDAVVLGSAVVSTAAVGAPPVRGDAEQNDRDGRAPLQLHRPVQDGGTPHLCAPLNRRDYGFFDCCSSRKLCSCWRHPSGFSPGSTGKSSTSNTWRISTSPSL